MLGISALAGSAALIAACTTGSEQDGKAVITGDSLTAEPAKEISDRDKLIVNRSRMEILDPAKPTELELKHTPEIKFGEVDEKGFVKVSVTLGSQGIIHPADDNHWIDYLKLYVDDIEFAHVENKNGSVRGFSDFWVKMQKGVKVKAEAGCNLHGIWENSISY